MTPPDLPDDFRKWPDDPYQLLRVQRGADRRTVRKAYTELVRRFKPEQFPREFRAIRDAYEHVIAAVDWREKFNEADEAWHPLGGAEAEDCELPALEFDGEPEGAAAEKDFAAPKRSSRFEQQKNLQEELDELWRKAQVGEAGKAYARLVEIEQQLPPRDAIYLRLYWLLVLYPELDAARLPIHWLVRALKANRLSGPLRELYRRELERNPREALGDECRGLLELRAAPAALVDLAEWRWRAAGERRKWDVLNGDLRRLAPILRGDCDDLWGRLLMSAVEQMAWTPPDSRPPLNAWCLEQMEQLDHMNNSLESIYERLDLLERVSAGWHKLCQWPRVPKGLIELARFAWDGPDAAVRQQAIEFVRPYVPRPKRLLKVFDGVRNGSPSALAQLHGVFLRVARQSSIVDEPAKDPAVFAPLVRDLLANRPTYDYTRPRLLQFCLQQAIPPDSVEWFATEWQVQLRDRCRLDDQIRADDALKCAYQALRLFVA